MPPRKAGVTGYAVIRTMFPQAESGRALGRLILLSLLFFLVLNTAVAGPIINPMSVGWTPPGEQWRSWETEHFRIHALARHEHWVHHVAREAEAAHAELSETLDWSPTARTELVLTDDHDRSNGWASVFPFNQSRLFLSPPDRFSSLEAYDDWLRLLIRHEYVHVLHLDQAEDSPAALQRVFGRMPLLFPHQFQPLWMIEGIATHLETDAAKGVGRGQSALSESRMRAEVLSGPLTLSEVTGLNRRWPPDRVYLYGVFFIEFLEETRGEDSLDRWLQAYRRNLLPFWLNPTARQAFGADFPELWEEYRDWLRYRFAPPADTTEPGEAMTTQGLFDEPPVAQGEAVYHIHRDGHRMPRLVRYRGNEREELARVDDPGLFDVDSQQRVVMAGLTPRRDNRILSDLYLWREDAGWQRLTEGQRYREARWLDRERLIARRIVDGQVELHLLTHRGEFMDELWKGRPGEVVGPFRVAPDGESLVAAFKYADRSGWQLRRFDLNARRWETLTDNGRIQGQPAFSPDGEWLLFTADYGGGYDLYRLHLDTGEKQRLTRSRSGAFSPVQTQDGRIWYQHYSSRGFDLYRLDPPEPEPVAPQPPVREREATAEAVEIQPLGRYSPGDRLAPTWWFPFINVDDETFQVGLTTSGQDALGRHSWELLAGRDDTSSNAFGTFNYRYDNRIALGLQRGISFFTDDDGEPIRARSEDSVSLRFLNLYNAMHDDLALDAGAFYERNSDLWRDGAQAPPAPSFRRGLSGVTLRFNNTERYWYSISPATGRSIRLVGENHDLLGDDFSGNRAHLDWREHLHISHSHVLSLRLAGVVTEPDAAGLRLGGDTPPGQQVFGRNRYPLRGYPSDAFVGQRFALASAEWRMPLWRIQRNWQVYPLGARDLHGRLFVDAGRLWRAFDPETENETFTGVGAELTLELVAGYRLPVPVSLGYARGLDSEFGEDRFWLRVGIAF